MHEGGAEGIACGSQRVGLVTPLRQHLGQRVVGELDVAVSVEQQVLRLEVAEDDALALQVADDEHGGRHVEFGDKVGERLAKQRRELACSSCHDAHAATVRR